MTGPATVTLDLHGMNCFQARTAVAACLRRADAALYRVRVIHGHHGGSALKEMLRAEFATHPKVRRLEPAGEGETVLVLKEW